MARYVEPRAARHRVESVDGVERVCVPVRRNWFVLAVLALWLAMWGAGGALALGETTRHFEPFLLVWLAFWALALLFVAAQFATLLAGSETLAVVDGDLEVSLGVGPLRRRWRYRGSAIRNLRRADPPGWMPWFAQVPQLPFPLRQRWGAVRFDYGAESVSIAAGVDGPEGAAIAAWLAHRLPVGATQGFAEALAN